MTYIFRADGKFLDSVWRYNHRKENDNGKVKRIIKLPEYVA
jgi:hypothetical protein